MRTLAHFAQFAHFALLLVLISPLTLCARSTQHKVFPATAGSVLAENQRADSLGIKRYETMSDVTKDAAIGILVPLMHCSPRLPRERRYALPATSFFASKLDSEFTALIGKHLIIDSAIRPSDVQKRLTRHNRNAAPAQGARASTHERGTTVDFSRRMTRGQYRWLIARLAYYKAIGEILIIEERSCIHVFVMGNQGALALIPVTCNELLVGLPLQPVDGGLSVQPGLATPDALPRDPED